MQGTMEDRRFNVPASRYIEALRRNRVDYFVTVPDWVQLALHKRIEEGVEGIHLVPCCNEDQAVIVSAGLRIGGKNPIVVVQNQGFHACVNSTRAVGLDGRIPIVFLVGQFGREFRNFGKDPAQSRARIVRLVAPVAEILGMRHWLIEDEADLRLFDEAFATALQTNGPVALVVGAPIGWD
jgi:sulfopyruvate decarboxylase TPP-binding subunit